MKEARKLLSIFPTEQEWNEDPSYRGEYPLAVKDGMAFEIAGSAFTGISPPTLKLALSERQKRGQEAISSGNQPLPAALFEGEARTTRLDWKHKDKAWQVIFDAGDYGETCLVKLTVQMSGNPRDKYGSQLLNLAKQAIEHDLRVHIPPLDNLSVK